MPKPQPASAEQVVLWHPNAPPKPPLGSACNGCGLCCLAEPCPLGVVISSKLHGTCHALRWDEDDQRYVCAMLVTPQDFVPLRWRWMKKLFQRWARRWIASGIGCDADLLAEASADVSKPSGQ